MSAGEPVVDVVVEAPGWEEALPDLAEAADTAACAALAAAGLEPGDHSIAVLACDDERIARLNAEFRGKKAPTNVLSWPAFDLAPLAPGAPPQAPPPPGGRGPVHLGDLAISLDTAAREAKARGISLKSHAMHLILHGCLHLLGHDHESEEDAGRMEGIESRVLTGLGIADPYLIVEPDADGPHHDR